MSAFFFLMAGPIPLCLSFLRFIPASKERVFSLKAFLGLTVWFILQTTTVLFLGVIGKLHLSGAVFAETVLFVSGTAALLCMRRRRIHEHHADTSAPALSKADLLLLGTILFIGCILFMGASSNVITDYDSLAYHLPALVKWIQAKAIVFLDLLEFEQTSYYSYHWECLSILCILPFHEDFLVSFINVVVWIYFGLSVYLLAVETGAGRRGALAGTLCVMVLPILLKNINTLHVDLAHAAFVLAGLYLVLLFVRTRSIAVLALLTGCLGMTAGIKLNGFLYVAVLLVLLFAAQTVYIIRNGKIVGIEGGVGWLGGFESGSIVLMGLFLGAFWHVRNALQSMFLLNDPFAFLKPKKEYLERLHKSTLSYCFHPFNWEHWKILLEQLLVQLYIPFLFMMVVVLLSAAGLFRKKSTASRWRRGVLMVLAVLFLCLYWVHPFGGDNGSHGYTLTPWFGQGLRYAFPFLGLLGVLASCGIDGIRLSTAFIAAVVIGISVLSLGYGMKVTAGQWALFPFVLLGLFWASAVWEKVKREKYARIAACSMAVLLLLVAGTWGGMFLREKRAKNRSAAYGPLVDYITDHVEPHEVIGFFLSARSYILSGRNLDRRFVYIPYLPVNEMKWVKYLETRKIRYVAVGPVDGAWTKDRRDRAFREHEWLEHPGGWFTKVCGRDPANEPVLYKRKRLD